MSIKSSVFKLFEVSMRTSMRTTVNTFVQLWTINGSNKEHFNYLNNRDYVLKQMFISIFCFYRMRKFPSLEKNLSYPKTYLADLNAFELNVSKKFISVYKCLGSTSKNEVIDAIYSIQNGF